MPAEKSTSKRNEWKDRKRFFMRGSSRSFPYTDPYTGMFTEKRKERLRSTCFSYLPRYVGAPRLVSCPSLLLEFELTMPNPSVLLHFKS